MGAKNSSELDNQRIAEIATEANGQFAKEFSIAFKDAVVNKIRNAYTQGNTKMSLLQADVPNQNIKTGYLLKLGANIKNWKRRKFVAKNKADNYTIVYYEDEEENHEKGRLSCCGYDVEAFTAEEVGWYGQYGIKLRSHADAKRVWLFRAENDEDQQQWVEVFMNACKKSKPDIQRDPVFSDAFIAAYRTTRAAYGYFGVFHVIGDECEMLEYLTNQILSREMLDQYIVERGARANSVARKNLMISVHNNVQKIIRPIVSSTWKNSYASVEGMKASFELSVKASLRLILDKESEIKAFLYPKIQSLVEPYIAELQTKTCMPILKCCFEDVVEAYEQSLLGFHREVSKVMGSIEFYPDTLGKELQRLEEMVEQVSSGPLVHSQRVLWKMHTSDLVEVSEVFEQSGISGYDLYIRTMDDIKGLLQSAIYTFGKLSQQAGGGGAVTAPPPPPPAATSTDGLIIAPLPASSVPVNINGSQHPAAPPAKRPLADVLNEVISKLTADSKITLQKGLTAFLSSAMECKVQEMMIAPCYEVTLSAAHLVTRETQLMINLNSLGEQMVRDIVSQYVASLMSDLMAEASSRLNMIAVPLIGDTPQTS